MATLESLHSSKSSIGVPMSGLYEFAGISRQGFFQAQKRQTAKNEMLKAISELVSDYRWTRDARAGSRSLYYNLNIKERFNIGVTKFEQLMSAHNWVLERLKVRVITTKSVKQSWNYDNLTNALQLTDINQLVVGDLTYIHYRGVRYYLFCLTDVYSARIVGHHLSTRMRSQEALYALNQWLKLRGAEAVKACIHHTDGGSQYFSTPYLKTITEAEIKISRANNCLENAYAEQRNGLIKNHLVPLLRGPKDHTSRDLARLIRLYNQSRKQLELGWLSPVEYENRIAQRACKQIKTLFNFEQ